MKALEEVKWSKTRANCVNDLCFPDVYINYSTLQEIQKYYSSFIYQLFWDLVIKILCIYIFIMLNSYIHFYIILIHIIILYLYELRFVPKAKNPSAIINIIVPLDRIYCIPFLGKKLDKTKTYVST